MIYKMKSHLVMSLLVPVLLVHHLQISKFLSSIIVVVVVFHTLFWMIQKSINDQTSKHVIYSYKMILYRMRKKF